MGEFGELAKFIRKGKWFYTRLPAAEKVAEARKAIGAESGVFRDARSWDDIRDIAYDTRSHGMEPLEQAARDMDTWGRGSIPKGNLDPQSRQFLGDEMARRAAWWDENLTRLERQKVKRKTSPNPSVSPKEAGLSTSQKHWSEVFRNTSLDGLFDK